MHPLDGIDAKIKHAYIRFDDLCREVRKFTDRRPFSIRTEDYEQDGKPSVRMTAVDNGVGSPPLRISLLAGEALYQLRSCLDHLIRQLVIANGQAVVLGRKHQFPICDDAETFLKPYTKQQIKGVSSVAADVCQGEKRPIGLCPGLFLPLIHRTHIEVASSAQ
jgi:hypothetical protein